MARYGVRYVTVAAQQRANLPPDVRRAYDEAENRIAEDPCGYGKLNKDTGAWFAAFGNHSEGLVDYVIGDNIITVTVIRIAWAG